jgi:hypothetical protein
LIDLHQFREFHTNKLQPNPADATYDYDYEVSNTKQTYSDIKKL